MKTTKEIDILFSYNLDNLAKYVDITHLNIIKKEYILSLNNNKELIVTESKKIFIIFLQRYILESIQEVEKLTFLIQEMRTQLSYLSSQSEKRKIILEYAYKFNKSKKELFKDEQAFNRWFDEDALVERIKSQIAVLNRCIIVAIGRIGSSIELISNDSINIIDTWDGLRLNVYFLNLLQYKYEKLVVHKSFKVLLSIMKIILIEEHLYSIDEKLFRYIYKVALSKKVDVWIQNDAIEFLADTKISSFIAVAKFHYESCKIDDTIFVRYKLASLSLLNSHKNTSLLEFVNTKVIYDPSAYVRQGIVKTFPLLDESSFNKLKSNYLLKDSDKSVRALAILQSLQIHKNLEVHKTYIGLIWESLLIEKDFFVLKTNLYTIKELTKIMKHDIDFLNTSIKSLNSFIVSDTEISLKRYASSVLEFVKIYRAEDNIIKYEKLSLFVRGIKQGGSKKIPEELLYMEDDILFKILSCIAQDGFCLELQHKYFNRYILFRGDRFSRRLWRIIYEFKTPSSDKRQDFLHTIARVYEGTYFFPSSILAEQAPTKVPGEPYYIPAEESWRPYLPLMDHFVSNLNQPTIRTNDYKIYSAEGITTIEPPTTFFTRIMAELKLSWNYKKIAELRNWQKESPFLASMYINTIEKLGFTVKFEAYVKEDKTATKFFPVVVPFIPLSMQENLENYFVSTYENTLGDLVIFLGLVFIYFFIKHSIASRKIKKSRLGIPLSVGGWGTRGKSGTERIKAALFNSLGLRVYSKTTGNEAMFIHSESFDKMREMYLFRPYDKATIWEQADSVILAEKLGVDVFLWESMGLTPSYVEILQKEWMKDDIATITNTYPDHEDLQGPAGINIPEVMTNFIPKKSILIASEEIMYPILKEYAESVGTPSYQVGWLEAGLIPTEITDRFPYEEHPYNIALVLRMAKELDIDENEALKAMADKVVPDLGVLKAYPSAHINKKRLRFINGMSANERFGALGNWQRMGFDKMDTDVNPEIFVSIVINNRADRVSRSKVFASMLVEDISADCYFIIGSNISGFQNFVEESWSAYKLNIFISADKEASLDQQLLKFAKKFRILSKQESLKAYLQTMLKPYTINDEQREELLNSFDNITTLEQLMKEYEEVYGFYKIKYEEYYKYRELSEKLQISEDLTALSEELRAFVWECIKKRVITIDNNAATGNEVVKVIVNHTPPGKENQIIGMQNIKGAGLDFVYRWVAWNECYSICSRIQSSDSAIVKEAIDELVVFKEHGPLSFELTQESIVIAKKSIVSQSEYYQAELHSIEITLNKAIENHSSLKINTAKESLKKKWLNRGLDLLESFLDAGDAIKRRKKANRIYKDLINKRVGHERAAKELQGITKRQKGGWLKKRFMK